MSPVCFSIEVHEKPNIGASVMLYDHDLEIDRSEESNPIYHFALDVDAEHIREMLNERGVQSDILAVDYAARLMWERMLEGAERVLDDVVEGMPKVGDDWDMLDEMMTTHIVYDEPEFWLALEKEPELWDPPSFRIEGRMLCKSRAVADAVRANVGKYPSFDVRADADGGLVVGWSQFFFLNLLLTSAVEERFEERFGKRMEIRVLASEVGFPVRGKNLGEMRDEVQFVSRGLDDGVLWNDNIEMRALGEAERERIGELDELLGVILSVDGVEGAEFHLEGRHVQSLEDGSNIPEHIRAMASIEFGVPEYVPLDSDDPDIPF